MRSLSLAFAVLLAGCSPWRSTERTPAIAVRFPDDPFLAPHDPAYEAYRFRDFGGLGGARVAIVIEKTAMGASLRVWTPLDGHARMVINRLEWDDLAQRIRDAGFWSMLDPERDELRPHERDGCIWILEGARGADNHAVGRNSVRSRTDERGLAWLVVFARRLAELARIDVRWLC